ncbi:MAG: ABC transporter transmembrane domain-containing protein [Flavobacteriales bacterium]|nr:ABC transporter transmembrane domain-containing protein [Flavobacteriales bacterium]
MARSNKEEKERRKIKKEDMKQISKLLRYLKPHRWTFTLGLVFLFLTGGTALIFPALMGELINASTAKIEDINEIALILTVVFIFQAVFSYFRIYLFSLVTEKSLAQLRKDLYSHLIRMPMSFFSSQRVGELNSRISSDISLLQETFQTTIAELIRQLIIIVGGVIFLSFISVKLTLFMLLVVPIIAVVAVFFGRYIKKLSKLTQDQIAQSNTVVEETFQGIFNVKSFTNEKFELGRYSVAIGKAMVTAIKGAKWRGGFASFIIFCLFGSIIAVVWRGTVLVQSDPDFMIGDLISFILYTVFIGASFGGVANLYSQVLKAIGATEKLFGYFEESHEEVSLEEIKGTPLIGNITLDAVNFAYPSRSDIQVLEDISFSVQAGEKVALVGASGSGKSTLVQLLMNFYQVENGQILIDGKSLASYEISDLRSQIGIVPQDTFLFGGTVRENILYGNVEASESQIIEAAKKANAFEFINAFPEKFETVVGERGVQLSGGQRQRVAIARAILKDPKILILDEATSALDAESEHVVQEALEELMKGRTSLIIAHRLATVKGVDRIIVLDKGKIAEVGSHEELIHKDGGIYANLTALQALEV